MLYLEDFAEDDLDLLDFGDPDLDLDLDGDLDRDLDLEFLRAPPSPPLAASSESEMLAFLALKEKKEGSETGINS